ncbi:hypothetical protein HYX07_02890 [Candidatus Woesearchaeota archaeon]|nr:hypothetical protein [Candidatus Woesearchaeota archaeon]
MDSKEDEDIDIDFGKIKNFFRAKSEKSDESKKEGHEAKEESKDEGIELSFDFGKIKNFFKQGDQSSDEQDIRINWNKVFDFFKKYGIVFIALIPIIFSIYIRMQAGDLHFADSWASSTVLNNIRSQIGASISQQYPNLPEANKNALIDAELQKITSQNNAQIDQQIKATSAYFKSFFQDENGKNYMPDIDPYYWVRYAKNIVEHGHPGDILKDGKPFDNHQLAPVGRFVFPDMFHAYSLAYFYKFVHFFVPDLSLMRSAFYLPVLVSALSVLLVFLIARKIAGNIGGFFAGLMMAVNASFLGRTLFGHADNDIWVIFFPLLITWLFVASIDVKSMAKILILTALAGFFTGLYASAWSGWWYIFDFLLAAVGITFTYLFLANFAEIKKDPRHIFSNIELRDTLIFGIGYFISSALFVALFSGWGTFRNSFLGPLSFPSIKAPVGAISLWPNVLTTVAELNEGSLNAIINSVGGPFLFFIGLVGLILTIKRVSGLRRFDFFYIIGTILFYGLYFMLKRIGIEFSDYAFILWISAPVFLRVAISIYKKDASYDFKLSLLLTLWITSTIFASIKGIRFTILLAPAFSVAFGAALGKAYSYVSGWLTKEFRIHKLISASILVILLLSIYITPATGAISAAGQDIPIINDAWYNTLISIKQDSKENAIITSWWDFGHHFKAIADRPVTFDGTTQTWPTSHWVGRFFMTDNEREAAGILRMIDCGSNKAFDELEKIKKDPHESYRIVKEIILLDKAAANKQLLENKLSQEQARKVLEFTHCLEPEAYVIASEDMIGKSGVWSHFGSWNFERADIWQNARNMEEEDAVQYMVKKFNYTKQHAQNLYFEIQEILGIEDSNTLNRRANEWIAPWPGYGGTISCSKNSQGVYACSNGFLVNISNYDAYAFGQQGIVRPRIAAFTTENGLIKKEFNGSVLDFGITIVPKNENEAEAILTSRELTGSMFTRMFYMQGHGLKYFKLFSHQRGLTGTDIYTYKVDWEGKNTTIIEDYIKYLNPINEQNFEDSVSIQTNSS